jgi:hypothetical protein
MTKALLKRRFQEVYGGRKTQKRVGNGVLITVNFHSEMMKFDCDESKH